MQDLFHLFIQFFLNFPYRSSQIHSSNSHNQRYQEQHQVEKQQNYPLGKSQSEGSLHESAGVMLKEMVSLVSGKDLNQIAVTNILF